MTLQCPKGILHKKGKWILSPRKESTWGKTLLWGGGNTCDVTAQTVSSLFMLQLNSLEEASQKQGINR